MKLGRLAGMLNRPLSRKFVILIYSREQNFIDTAGKISKVVKFESNIFQNSKDVVLRG